MLDKLSKEKKLEIAFISVFSALIVILFYTLISLNGLVLGTDPAVHLAKAQLFLKTGQIPLTNIGWIPPLFEILLAMAISFSGATSVLQLILIEKILAVVIDLFLFLSLYLVASKFFNKKTGAVAAVFLAMCYPVYELNTWGGYTTALGISFLLLMLYYSYSAAKPLGYVVVSFFVAFAIVLSHQLTLFLAVIIMLPTMIVLLIKFRRTYIMAFIALIAGGTTAFFAFYFPVVANYLDVAIYHVFFGNKTYSVEIPFTNLQMFLLYFSFIQFLAVVGIAFSYCMLKRQKRLIEFTALLLSLFIPLFFAESYVFGFFLPFEWFIYYLAPPIAIFGAVCVVFLAEKLPPYFNNNRHSLHKRRVRIAALALIALVSCSLIVFDFSNTYNEVILDAASNSKADIKAYEAATWLKQNYPDSATVVDTMNPGDWFSIFSDKHVISQTYDWEGTNHIAESVLKLDYELQGSQTLVKAYEVNGFTTDENYVSINQLWYRTAFSSLSGDFLSFNQNGVSYSLVLSNLSRTLTFQDNGAQKELTFRFVNDQVGLTQKIVIQNDTYSTNVSWSILPLNGDVLDVKLYLTTYFDLQFHFDKADVPQVMDWINPWDVTSKTANGNEWATVNFSASTLTNHYIGLYDEQKQAGFGFYFIDLPDWGNIGALANRQIDAVRYQYDFNRICANQTVTRQYQTLTLSKNSYPTLQQDTLQGLFNFKLDPFPVTVHNYREYIAENNIGFIVYDKNQIDAQSCAPLGSSFLPQIANCQFLELVYSNDRYDIFKVLDTYNQTQVWT